MATLTRDNALDDLEQAAKAKDASTFLTALKDIDWDRRNAKEFIRAIDLALSVGAHLAARTLATQGAAIHFDSEDLQKYARVLAPPKVLNQRSSSNVKPKANVAWLTANKDNYRGKWVAIKDGTFLGSGNSYKDLIAQIGKTKGLGILVTPVY